jgi:hypothetical protein
MSHRLRRPPTRRSDRCIRSTAAAVQELRSDTCAVPYEKTTREDDPRASHSSSKADGSIRR